VFLVEDTSPKRYRLISAERPRTVTGANKALTLIGFLGGGCAGVVDGSSMPAILLLPVAVFHPNRH